MAPSDPVDESPKWLKGPDSKVDSHTPPTDSRQEEAVQAAREVLESADELQSAGQLRKAFLECQSVLIDHSHNLPDGISAQVHHLMARISLSQGKPQRADKYLKRALSLDPSLPRMEELVQVTNQSVGNKPPPVGESRPKPELEPEADPEISHESQPEPGDEQPNIDTSPVIQPAKGRLAWVASFWSRALALAMDAVLLLVLVSIMVALSSLVLGFSKEDLLSAMAGSLSNVIVVFMLFVLFMLTYATVFARFGGQTLGKIIFGLRVVRLDGHSLTTANALLRAVGMLLAAMPGLGGFVWAAFDMRKRGWHDMVGKTLVVKIKPPRTATSKSEVSIEALEHP